jgi:hypothetical protein
MRPRADARTHKARELFDLIEPELFRLPAIDPAAFRARVERELRGR